MKTARTIGERILWVLLSVLVLSVAQPPAVRAAEDIDSPREVVPQHLRLVVGKSRIVNTAVLIKRASMANPAVADTVVLSPTQLYLVAKTVGVTNLTLWDQHDRVLRVFDLEVVPDLDRLRAQVHQLMPEEHAIEIEASHDFVTLSGTVKNPASPSRVQALAEAYAPQKVINLLRVEAEAMGAQDQKSQPVVVDLIKGASVQQVQF